MSPNSSLASKPTRGIWQFLTAPIQHVGNETDRRRSQMLAAIIVVTFPIAVVALGTRAAMNPSYLPRALYLMVATWSTLIPYWLARNGRWRVGTYSYLLVSQALITYSMMTDITSATRFQIPLIMVLAAALLLEIKDTAIIALLNILGLVGIFMVSDPATQLAVADSITFLFFTTAVVLLTRHHRDRLEHTRAQEQARRSARRRQLLEATFDGIAILEEGIIQESNEGMCSLLGYPIDEVLHKRLSYFMSAEFQEPTEKALQSPDQCIHELVARRFDRNPVHLEVLFEPLRDSDSTRHLIALRNTTNRKQLQARLQIADRMAAIGSLAAGLAHEINNPLTYVLANLEEASQRISNLEEPNVHTNIEKANECLHIATEGAGRVQRTIQDLKTLSRSDDEPVSPVNVQEVLDSTIGIALSTVKHRGKLTTNHEQTRSALANKSRLGQVFLNLIINASQSLPGDRNLQIRIDSYEDKEHIIVEIRDTGSGISPDELDRIFDPYYTTKPVGVGTGLGLWVSRNLLHNMGGEIEVESTVGEGSIFRVILTATNKNPMPAPIVSPQKPRQEIRARILVVDDEPAILQLLADILHPAHAVTLANGGALALKSIQEQSFDLVICDLMMPDLSGMELYERLLETQQQSMPKFLFLTGGAVNNRSAQFVSDRANTILQKPFQPKRLRNAVQDILSAP